MKIKLFFTALFFTAFFYGIFPNICYGGSAYGNLLLKTVRVSKSKNSDSYLIWFKFNKKPEGIIRKLGLNGYSLELAFKNAQSGIGSKFIRFHNRLFKAVEIMPVKNSGLNAVIYFHKNIKITQKDTYATFYGSYFIIKIHHVFQEDLFKNVGKKSPALAAVSPAKSNFGHNNVNQQKNKIKQAALSAGSPDFLKTALKTPADNEPLNMGFEVVKTAVYLSLIIGLIYAVYFLMNKFKNRVSVKEKLNNLKIVSSINLGNKKSILLIEVNKEFFLVGASQSNIQVIGHLKGNAGNAENAPSKAAADADAGAYADTNADANTYAISEAGAYLRNAKAPAGDAAFQQSPSPAIRPYGKFADAMREQVSSYAGESVSALKIKAGQPQYADIASKPDTFKVKNINEAKFKGKADNVFFDIEERLKGLMESNGNNKKF
ncbi:MAG: FliO/MopB family protein [bacterium]